MKQLYLFFICIAIISAQSDWPQWRGENASSISQDSRVLQNGKSYKLKTLWKRSLGSGYSSISIWDRYAVTMYSDGKKDYVFACNAHSGEKIWQYTIGDTYVGHDGSHDGPISTPVLEENYVFALDAHGQLLCLQLNDGSLVWKKDLPVEHEVQKPFYGFGTSPILYKNFLIVQTGSKKGTISAFDKKSGALIWTMGDDAVNYQSPLLINNLENTHLLCGGNNYLYCIDPENGKEIWRYEHKGGNWSTAPTVVGKTPWQIFLKYKGGEAALLELTGDEKEPVKKVWTTRHIKKAFSPPVVLGDKIYGYSGRFFSCIDVKKGKKIWKSRQPGDGFFIVVNDHFVLITKDGHLHLANDSSGKYKSLDKQKVFDDLVWTPPSFAHGKIYIRSLGEIACVSIANSDSVVSSDTEVVYEKVESQFSDFVEKVRNSANKKELIDAFMEKQKQFPITEKNSIHFVYRGEADDVGFEGDIIGFRIDYPMQRIPDTNFFYFSSYLEEDACIAYRFIKNFDEILTDPLNKKTSQNFFGTFSTTKMPKWKAAPYLKEAQQKGTTHKLSYESEKTKDKRELTVYLPHNYDSKKSYATLFIHDGTSALKQGKWQNTLDNLIAEGLPATIAVFIPQKHGREYSVEASRNNYINLLVSEWIPFLESKYSTKNEPKFNIGFVNGATLALYATAQNPNIFSGGASVSAFYLKKEELELSSLVKKIKEPVKFYISWGKYDLRSPYEGWSLIDSGVNVAKAINEVNENCVSKPYVGGFSWENWRNENGKILKFFLEKDNK
ncbi:PQQ-binding-like beta-propeller repeat protein [Candidatus Uabimicrobium sp. HlEnr_7]|uniref:outer membrane protein assembly factor BamB family protein n=1 Tax=Candidatus Uabimicrobium helgolandensis TaxID=3095367 RepID=UPI0035582DF3